VPHADFVHLHLHTEYSLLDGACRRDRLMDKARNGIPVCQKENDALAFCAMSTLVEIQDAVARLPGSERKALQLWLNSLSEPELPVEEEHRLLRSLDEALREIDTGKGVPLNDVRKRVASWAAR